MAQLPMKSKAELCPVIVGFPPNKSNVRIDPEETQDEPIFELCLEIVKNNTVYTALTDSAKGIVNAKNVDIAVSLWEDFRFQINKHKNIRNKHETMPYPRFTKLIIRYLLSQHPTLYKCLDSTTNLVSDDTLLENMKYVAKGERKQIFGMTILEALLSSKLKESQAYVAYMGKYLQAQVPHKHGMGKGFIKKGDVPKPKKKKDAATTRSKLITAEDNVLSDSDDELEYTKQRIDKGEGSGAAPEYLDNSSSSEDSSESAIDDKTKGERVSENKGGDVDSEQGDESDKSSSNEGSRDYDESDKDSEKGADQTRALMTEVLNKPVYTEATTMMVDHVLETIHEEEEQVTSIPLAIPSTKTKVKRARALLKKAISKKNDCKKVIMQRLTNLEQKTYDDIIEESVQENVLTAVKNQLPKLLRKVVSQALKKTPVNKSRSKPATIVDPTEYELKQQLYEKMFQTAAYLNHPKHHALYDALVDSMQMDEHEARFGSIEPSQSKRTHDDQDDPDNRERRKRAREGENMLKDEPRQDDEQVHEVQTKRIPEEPEEFEYSDGLVTKFGKLVKKIFKKDVNLESGDRFQKDLSKPLPLTGPPGKKRIPVRYLFNHDLEYLMNGTKENTYALSIAKTKAARYEDEGIEEVIPSLWIPMYSKLNIKSSQSIKVNKKFGYAYLEEIVVTRADEKEYKFCEANFPNLNQNVIGDVILLKIQNKARSIKGVVYEGVDNRKSLMRSDELHKFSNDNLNKVLSKLEIIPRNNKLGYDNEEIEKYYWTKDDDKKTRKFVEKIEKTLKERRRFIRLELFVGGRHDKTDYRLLIRPE
uniref:Uncharacterized protein n=1 Tax=Tanacetum cinerariifolium TaxID=118510 RepID=A0A6L2KQX2_TANCI|nr:hypothetical protein [Tanacetum cinerariifolium]